MLYLTEIHGNRSDSLMVQPTTIGRFFSFPRFLEYVHEPTSFTILALVIRVVEGFGAAGKLTSQLTINWWWATICVPAFSTASFSILAYEFSGNVAVVFVSKNQLQLNYQSRLGNIGERNVVRNVCCWNMWPDFLVPFLSYCECFLRTVIELESLEISGSYVLIYFEGLSKKWTKNRNLRPVVGHKRVIHYISGCNYAIFM